MGTSLFFEGERTPLCASLPLAAATRAEREEFFGTRTPQGGFSCRFAAIHLLSRQKTIEIDFASADAWAAVSSFAALRMPRTPCG